MAKLKVVKRHWYPIVAPATFNHASLGETLVGDPQQMLGKGLTQNLMSLTNDVRRQNINIHFKIKEVREGKAITNIVGYQIIQSSVKRMVRRSINKLDMSFLCKTQDNVKLRLKPLLITRSLTKGSVQSRLRNTALAYLLNYVEKVSYDELLNKLLAHKLQEGLKAHLKKIYPLKVCEIRSMEIVKDDVNVQHSIIKNPQAKPEQKKHLEPKDEKVEKTAEKTKDENVEKNNEEKNNTNDIKTENTEEKK